MKRVFDLLLASLLILLLLPVFLLISILIRVILGKPVLFKQIRPGKYEKPFCLYKFRTMIEQYDTEGMLLPDHLRITRFGTLLRRLSLDELPQLWNVIRGDLSLVGPRPLLMEFLPLYTPEQAKRHLVKPGITGWAQVHGRNNISWDEKLKLDQWYVEHHSFIIDLKILWLTLFKVLDGKDVNVLGCKDINQLGQTTIEKFKKSQ